MKYYIYKHVNDNWVSLAILDNYSNLIRYLFKYQQHSHYYWNMNKHDAYWYDCFGKRHYNNSILDEINMSGKDISYDTKGYYKDSIYYSEKIAYIRPYMIFDEENRIIDPRNFYHDILNYKPESYYSNWHWRGYKHSRYHSERSLKYGRILRMINHPDFKEYNRIGNLDSVVKYMAWWDSPLRHYDKSWKSSFKVRKQYQKSYKQKNRKKS